jgi:hypothetical protein
MNYISSFFMIPGLILLGQALEQHFNYGVIIIGWGMYVFGVMTASVAVRAFISLTIIFPSPPYL